VLVITGVVPTDAIFGSPIAAETLSKTPKPVPIVVNDALSKITSDDIQKIIERALANYRADGEAQSGQSSQVDTREIIADVLQQIQASGGPELASSEVENLVIQAAAEQPSRPPTAIPIPT